MADDVIAALADSVGTENVITDPDVMAAFCTDWTRRFGGPALCVVRPGSTGEAAAVLRACFRAGVPVIPQGGNTGLVGGGVPASSMPALPAILSMRRINWIGDVDQASGQVSCGAGATLGEVQRAASAAGWMYGVDLAARDTATIGGTVATNAGGIHVVAHGMTRKHVVGVEAVLADGTVVSHMAGLVKDNTGFDFASLLCGSEGTLAVITAVRLGLVRPTLSPTVALVAVTDYSQALALIRSAIRSDYQLLAAEMMDATGMELACAVTGLSYPFAHPSPFVLLLEVADGGQADGFDFEDDLDVVVGADAAERERLWRYREAQADGFATLGVIHKLDVSVPLAVLPQFADAVTKLLQSQSTVTNFGVFGHLGDGNLHVEFAGPEAEDEAVDALVLKVVHEFGGSISAEHGVGRHKAEHLGLSRSPQEIAAMRAIKDALDSTSILNPGVIFGESTTAR